MSEVQELPPEWVLAKLQDIAYSSGTCNPKAKGPGEFLYIDIEALDNSKQTIVAPKRLSNMEAPSRARVRIKANDVIFSLVRPYLKNVAVIPVELDEQVASTAYCALTPETGISSQFIFYALVRDSFIHSIPTYGGSPPSARDEEFWAMNVPVAPIPEQQRIVEALEQQLSRLDAGVVALRSTQQKLKRYRTSVLKAAVEGKLTQEWRKSHPEVEPASELLKRILQERRAKWEEEQIAKGRDLQKVKYEEPAGPDVKGLHELPMGWCWATVEKISHFVRYGTSAKTTDDSTGIPVLRMGNIQEGVLDINKLKYLAQDHDEFPNLFLLKNDLLFNRTNSPELVGKSAVYKGILSPCSYASYLISVRFVQDHLSDYVCFFLNSTYGRNWVASVVSQQVGQANVNGTKLLALTFPLPPLAEQEQIVSLVEERLSIVSTLESTIQQVLKRAERMRQSILHRAFTGKLVAQDPNDEPASVLLERIRKEREEATALQKLKHLAYKENGKSSRKRVAESTQPYLLADVPDPEPVDAQATTQGGLWD